jgi:rhodanese-related sulfurtransferase
MTIKNLTAADVARGLKDNSIVLIDVREPAEYAAQRIHGGLLFPLSTFDPHALPDCGKRSVVFQCASGIRSARAVAACQKAGMTHDSHLKGGIQAWKAAGLPTVSVDPATGQTRDRR